MGREFENGSGVLLHLFSASLWRIATRGGDGQVDIELVWKTRTQASGLWAGLTCFWLVGFCTAGGLSHNRPEHCRRHGWIRISHGTAPRLLHVVNQGLRNRVL